MTPLQRLAEAVLTDPARARELAAKITARHSRDQAARKARARARPEIEAVKRADGRKAAKRESAKERRLRTRAEVVKRAEGRCEAKVVAPGPVRRCSGFAAEWDHFWGRAREESVESTWMLCPRCHFEKTRNHPDRRLWLLSFKLHANDHGYWTQARKVENALALEAAQHPASRASRAQHHDGKESE